MLDEPDIVTLPERKSCEGCPFRGPKVGSKGPLDAPIVVVGESPGAEESRKKYPFAGPSGKLLHTLLPQEGVLYLNALECVPPSAGKRKAKLLPVGTQACRGRLIEQVSQYPRKMIVALGNAAIQSLTGNMGLKITQIRGKLIKSEYAEIGIIPAIHPAALLRGTGSYRQFKEDLTYAWELGNGAEPRQYSKPEYEILHDMDRCRKILKWLGTKSELTGDIETSSLSPLTGRILTLGIAIRGKKAYVIPEEYIRLCKPLLESPTIKWCWHNGKFDTQFFHAIGIKARVDDDTLLMSYALDENPGVHDLETISSDVLGAPDYKYMVQPYLPNKESSYELIPKDVLYEYVSIDTGNTARLRYILKERLQRDTKAWKLYQDLLIPASPILGAIETRGMYVDIEEVQRNGERLQEEMAHIRAMFYELTDSEVNMNSPAQLAELLYVHLKYPNRSKGSTDSDALEKLPQTEIVKLIQRHRIIAKQYGTYVQSLLGREKSKGKKAKVGHIQKDGRVHATYLLHGTVTGRLASRKPNMQNIPRDSTIRGQFTAAPGYVLIEVDLSQAELRSLACMSGDQLLIDIFLSGRDLHGEVAARVFGPNYTDEQRVAAKAINFGIVYGITGPGLADGLGTTVAEATSYIETWYTTFHVAASFIKRCRAAPIRMQTISTVFGRQKRIGIVTAQNLHSLQNEAANFPHQAVASDITLKAAIKGAPLMRKKDAWLVNLIHDAQLYEVPNDPNTIKYVATKTVEIMQSVPIEMGMVRVPFLADVKIGQRWGNLDKLKPGGKYDYVVKALEALNGNHG